MKRIFITFILASGLSAQQPSADQLLKNALAEQQSGRLPAAIRDYRAVIKLRPAALEPRVNLGAALAQQGDFDVAIAEFKAALPLAKASEQASILLDLGLAFYKKGDFAGARPALQRVISLQPANLQAAILLADSCLKLNDPASALAVLEPRAAFARNNSDFGYTYGAALIRSGKLRDGANILQTVADSTNAADVFFMAGSTYLQIGEYETSRKDLEAAFRLNPGMPGLATLLGIARDRNGDAASAEVAFREALKAQPTDPDLNIYLAAVLLKRRQLDEARQHLDIALKAQPDNIMGLYENGMYNNYANHLDLAVADLKRATTLNPTWLEPHVLLASVFYKLQRKEEGAAERKIVDKLTADQQAAGTGETAPPGDKPREPQLPLPAPAAIQP